jgi:hypothetical protein
MLVLLIHLYWWQFYKVVQFELQIQDVDLEELHANDEVDIFC